MFTGIIEYTGTLLSSKTLGEGLEMCIRSTGFGEDIKIGESISINGACTTVCKHQNQDITIQILKETLEKTTFATLSSKNILNIERSLTLEQRLGGHYLTGHIDCTGKIVEIETKDMWKIITIEYPKEFAPLLVMKGSVAIDGISLTVSQLTNTTFGIHLIPHTLSHTNLSTLTIGSLVNLEFDLIGKYIQRYQEGLNHGE